MPPRPIPAPASAGTTRSTDVPLYWCTYGASGDPRLLVLHGGPGAHHDYLLPQMLALTDSAGGRELLLYDQRGGGRSKTSDQQPITWETQVRDVAAVLTEFAMRDPVIVGYSWGGLLALLYAAWAARHSEQQPRALVLIDPAPVSRRYRGQFEAEFARRQASADVQRMRDAQVHAFLVGEAFMRADDPGAALADLFQ